MKKSEKIGKSRNLGEINDIIFCENREKAEILPAGVIWFWWFFEVFDEK